MHPHVKKLAVLGGAVGGLWCGSISFDAAQDWTHGCGKGDRNPVHDGWCSVATRVDAGDGVKNWVAEAFLTQEQEAKPSEVRAFKDRYTPINGVAAGVFSYGLGLVTFLGCGFILQGAKRRLFDPLMAKLEDNRDMTKAEPARPREASPKPGPSAPPVSPAPPAP